MNAKIIEISDDEEDSQRQSLRKEARKRTVLGDRTRLTAMSKDAGTSAYKRKAKWITSSFGDFEELASTQTKKEPKKPNKKKSIKDYSVSNVLPDFSLSQVDEGVSWVDKYKPSSEVDIAVQKNKVTEVRKWLLENLTSSSRQRSGGILLLTGPAGSGKSATLDVLSKELTIEVQEWVTPFSQTQQEFANWKEYNPFPYESQTKQFQDFLLRANKYPSLSVLNQVSNEPIKQDHKIVLVEDIPTVFSRDVKKFHELLRQYKAMCRNPLVFIISDSCIGDNNAYSLFPKNIQIELGITSISFKPVTQTSMIKAMSRIASKESRLHSKTFKQPTKDTFDLLATSSSGDIRACINALQFYCTREYHHKKLPSSKSSTSKDDPKKFVSSSAKRNDNSRMTSKTVTEDEESALNSIGGKDVSLFLFRALGKILYCKREPQSMDERNKQLPNHLRRHARNRLLVDPEDAVERTHMSGDTFNLYLQQNYLDFFSDTDDMAEASQYLSDADVLTGVWSSRDTLRDYSSSVAARGIMFSNQHKSSSSSSTTGSGWKPLHKSQWFDMFKKITSNQHMAKAYFQELRHPAEVLHTEVIPFIAKVNLHLQTPSRISYLETMSQFYIGKTFFRPSLQTLDNENAELDLETEESCQQATNREVRPDSKLLQKDSNIEDDIEDEVIEEFSDDD